MFAVWAARPPRLSSWLGGARGAGAAAAAVCSVPAAVDLRSPSTLVAAWALVPLLVVAASASLGWALGVLGGIRLGSLTVPAGFCAGIALMTFCLTLGFSGK